MKTLSTMYMRLNVGVIVLTHSSTFHMPSLFTQIHSNCQVRLQEGNSSWGAWPQ